MRLMRLAVRPHDLKLTMPYERTASCEDARAGMRNGYCPTTVIILSRESGHAFDQGFSDEDSVVDAVLSMAR